VSIASGVVGILEDYPALPSSPERISGRLKLEEGKALKITITCLNSSCERLRRSGGKAKKVNHKENPLNAY
jgi:hypothetical protein